MTYNVHACVGRDGRFEPQRIAAVMESLHADFFALQEVEDRLLEGGDTVSSFLATRLDMRAYRGMTLRREDSEFGNLLLTKHEAQGLRRHDISVVGGEPRGCIEADFVFGDQRLRLLVTHLGLRTSERLKQVRQLMPALNNNDADVSILAGDINEWRPWGRVQRELHEVFGPGPQQRTFPSSLPTFALDRIYVSPSHALTEMRTPRTAESRIASDHLPVVCDVTLAASR